MKSLVFLVLFLVQQVGFANAGDAAAGIAATIGVGVAMSATAASGLAPYEAVIWADPSLKTTSKLSYQCGLVVETKIFSLVPYSVLYVAVKNESAENIQVFNNQATVTYNEKMTRFFDLDLNHTVYLPAKTFSGGYFKFHQRSDFRDATQMKFSLPVAIGEKSCTIEAVYNRNPDATEADFADSEIFTFGLYLGPSFIAGDLTDLTNGTTGTEFRMETNVIGKSGHGMYVDLGVTSIGASDGYKAAHPLLTRTDWSVMGVGIGYLYRKSAGDNKNVVLKIGPDFGYMRIGSSSDGYSATSSYLGGSVGVRYNVLFSQIERGSMAGKYFYNVGVNSRYVPKVDFDGQEKSGFLHSLVLGISIGM